MHTSHGDLGLRLDGRKLVGGRAHVGSVGCVINSAARGCRVNYVASIRLIVVTENIHALAGSRQNQCVKYLGEIILSVD